MSQGKPLKPFRCFNPPCAGEKLHYDFAADKPVCPQCGRAAQPLAIIHLLVEADNGTVHGGSGKRWRFACDESNKQNIGGERLGTGEPDAATCPQCLAAVVAVAEG